MDGLIGLVYCCPRCHTTRIIEINDSSFGYNISCCENKDIIVGVNNKKSISFMIDYREGDKCNGCVHYKKR